MDLAAISGDIERVIVTEEALQARIKELAAQVDKDYEGKDLLLVGVLKGAVMAVADLSRALQRHVEMDWMAVSSYSCRAQRRRAGARSPRGEKIKFEVLAGLRRSRQHRRYLEKVKWDGQPGLRGSRLGRWGVGEKLRFVALMPGLSRSRHERAGVLRRRPVVRIGRPGRRPCGRSGGWERSCAIGLGRPW